MGSNQMEHLVKLNKQKNIFGKMTIGFLVKQNI
jgi:hypothetical protein